MYLQGGGGETTSSPVTGTHPGTVYEDYCTGILEYFLTLYSVYHPLSFVCTYGKYLSPTVLYVVKVTTGFHISIQGKKGHFATFHLQLYYEQSAVTVKNLPKIVLILVC